MDTNNPKDFISETKELTIESLNDVLLHVDPDYNIDTFDVNVKYINSGSYGDVFEYKSKIYKVVKEESGINYFSEIYHSMILCTNDTPNVKLHNVYMSKNIVLEYERMDGTLEDFLTDFLSYIKSQLGLPICRSSYLSFSKPDNVTLEKYVTSMFILILKHLLNCIKYTHSYCIHHADIHEGNIMYKFTDKGIKFKLGDFGLCTTYNIYMDRYDLGQMTEREMNYVCEMFKSDKNSLIHMLRTIINISNLTKHFVTHFDTLSKLFDIVEYCNDIDTIINIMDTIENNLDNDYATDMHNYYSNYYSNSNSENSDIINIIVNNRINMDNQNSIEKNSIRPIMLENSFYYDIEYPVFDLETAIYLINHNNNIEYDIKKYARYTYSKLSCVIDIPDYRLYCIVSDILFGYSTIRDIDKSYIKIILSEILMLEPLVLL